MSSKYETEEPLYEPTPTDSQQPAPGGASENTAVALYDYQAGESESHSMCAHCNRLYSAHTLVATALNHVVLTR